uniref:Putative secreted protein n=1 Tax=Anopheles darlingi TaxID=43151 RepID=A0A2M4DPE2_ANODA
MMLQILYVLVLSGLIYLALAWILPKVIGYGLRKLYKIEINVGRFAFPLSLRDVTVCKSGYSVQIDEISLQSSFVNSDVSKLLSINVRDLRINKDIKKSPVVTGGAGTVQPAADLRHPGKVRLVRHLPAMANRTIRAPLSRQRMAWPASRKYWIFERRRSRHASSSSPSLWRSILTISRWR